MRCAAWTNMRPSWPPPITPSVAPGAMNGSRATSDGMAALGRGQLGRHRARRLGLARPEGLELRRAGRVAGGQHGDGEQRRVGGAGGADREGRDRDALGHLHDAVQRIDALQVRLATGTPSTGTVVFAASMPGQVGGAAGAGDDGLQAAPAGAPRRRRTCRRACDGRDDARFMGDAELGENLGRGAAGVPVAAGAHHHADHRGSALMGFPRAAEGGLNCRRRASPPPGGPRTPFQFQARPAP